MRRHALALFALLTVISACARETHQRPKLDPTARRITRSGEVAGFVGSYDNHAWNGIPYAQPPVNGLRWRAPRRPAAWTGLREALDSPPPCPQYASMFGGREGRNGEIIGTEDCLYLNVTAPRFLPDEVPKGDARLPVMVWIHGGGNSIGEGSFYNGGNLSHTHKLVVVTFNYRLGPLGWLRSPGLQGDGTSPEDRSGNYGTLDTIRALEWVRENIEAFGGNPDNVTVFGESAGAVNVMALLASPKANGLFHRAVAQSGGPWTDTVASAENFVDAEVPGHAASSSEITLRLLINHGQAADRDRAKTTLARMSAAQLRQFLYARSAGEVLAAYPGGAATGMIDMPKLFREGVVLPREEFIERFASADGFNQVPVIFGTNRDENKLFMYPDPELVRKFLWLVPEPRDPRWYELTAEYLAKMWKANGTDRPASAMRGTGFADVYGYRFDWDEEPTVLGADLGKLLGAAHAFEIPFVFGHFDLGKQVKVIFTDDNAPGRTTLAAQMMSYWAQFAYTGSPGRGRDGTLPEWSAWGAAAGEPKYLVFDTAAGGGLRMDDRTWTKESVIAAIDGDARFADQKERCAMFAELSKRSRALTPAEYGRAGSKGCAEFPL